MIPSIVSVYTIQKDKYLDPMNDWLGLINFSPLSQVQRSFDIQRILREESADALEEYYRKRYTTTER